MMIINLGLPIMSYPARKKEELQRTLFKVVYDHAMTADPCIKAGDACVMGVIAHTVTQNAVTYVVDDSKQSDLT